MGSQRMEEILDWPSSSIRHDKPLYIFLREVWFRGHVTRNENSYGPVVDIVIFEGLFYGVESAAL